MIDKMYINYGNEEEDFDIIARRSDEVLANWYLIDRKTGNPYPALSDNDKDYSKTLYMENDVPIYKVELDDKGTFKSFSSENGFVYKAIDLKRYLDYHLDNQNEPTEFPEEDTVNDMVSSDFEYKIGKVNSALGALKFMEYQGVSHEMVVQAMNDVRDNIDAYLNQSKRWKNK